MKAMNKIMKMNEHPFFAADPVEHGHFWEPLH